jgi:DtxR family Mn-dependent transcriptional regulator
MDSLKSTERILSEDALKHIYKCEQKGRRPTLESVAGSLQIGLDKAGGLIDKMAAHQLLRLKGEKFHLSRTGRNYALQVIRAHRLWERYLADETGFDQAEWHDRAEQQEHTLSAEEADALAARLGHPTHDPHGDPIPTSDGEIVYPDRRPLTELKPGQPARIVHLEDEPPVVYAQLIAEGLHPGMSIRLTEVAPERIRFESSRAEHVLAPMMAVNISVAPLSEEEYAAAIGTGERLADLQPGQQGRVVNISPNCRGPARRRFMDLGILPGTIITAEMRSPGGDPTAYNIRGALIALRREQANLINITHIKENHNGQS